MFFSTKKKTKLDVVFTVGQNLDWFDTFFLSHVLILYLVQYSKNRFNRCLTICLNNKSVLIKSNSIEVNYE